MLSKNRPSKATKTREKLLKEVTDMSEKKRRLNTDIEDSLYKKIKIQAIEEGRSVSEITRQLWVEYLSNRSK